MKKISQGLFLLNLHSLRTTRSSGMTLWMKHGKQPGARAANTLSPLLSIPCSSSKSVFHQLPHSSAQGQSVVWVTAFILKCDSPTYQPLLCCLDLPLSVMPGGPPVRYADLGHGQGKANIFENNSFPFGKRFSCQPNK